MNIIISGCRDFHNEKIVYSILDERISTTDTIIAGGCRGVDALAIQYAKSKGIAYKIVPADWNTYGKAAGPIRNMQMAYMADSLIAFWDGKSRGTANMIQTMRNKLGNVHIHYIKKGGNV